jgi:hypothetical protein
MGAAQKTNLIKSRPGDKSNGSKYGPEQSNQMKAVHLDVPLFCPCFMSTAQLRCGDAAMFAVCDISAHEVPRSLCYLSPVSLSPGNGSAWSVVARRYRPKKIFASHFFWYDRYRPKQSSASVCTWGSVPHFFSMTSCINFSSCAASCVPRALLRLHLSTAP